MCDALLEAQKEVFICDWWLSPELYLKRPVSKDKNQEYRLDRVLKKIADRGVKINIILYKEVTFALYNDCRHAKGALEKESNNIEVLVHPGYYVFMWSHHEKLLVIDQKVGFMGGLDLCYGRSDRNDHLLSDELWLKDKTNALWPGIDYYNVRLRDFQNVQDFEQEPYDRNKDPRMPWHDISIKVIGEPVKDMCRHFIQYWNFVKTDLAPKNKQQLIAPHETKTKDKKFMGKKGGDNLDIEEKPSALRRFDHLWQHRGKSANKREPLSSYFKKKRDHSDRQLDNKQLGLGVSKSRKEELNSGLMVNEREEQKTQNPQTAQDDSRSKHTKAERLAAYVNQVQKGADDDAASSSLHSDNEGHSAQHKEQNGITTKTQNHEETKQDMFTQVINLEPNGSLGGPQTPKFEGESNSAFKMPKAYSQNPGNDSINNSGVPSSSKGIPSIYLLVLIVINSQKFNCKTT